MPEQPSPARFGPPRRALAAVLWSLAAVVAILIVFAVVSADEDSAAKAVGIFVFGPVVAFFIWLGREHWRGRVFVRNTPARRFGRKAVLIFAFLGGLFFLAIPFEDVWKYGFAGLLADGRWISLAFGAWGFYVVQRVIRGWRLK